jgi:hypothetical protein
MSQKSRFKMQTQGIHTFRKTFPHLPWNVVKNPTFIQTAHGYVFLDDSRLYQREVLMDVEKSVIAC